MRAIRGCDRFVVSCRTNVHKIPNSENHKEYVRILRDKDVKVVIAHGPAGTGKTYLASQHISNVIGKRYDKLVITRPTIGVDESLGYLPGNLNDKMKPWIEPIKEYILLNDDDVVPLSYLRGRTFNDTIVIADEMQNSTSAQFKTLLTRIGENCKVVITGDLAQSDVGTENGLSQFISLYNKYSIDELEKEVKIIEFNNDDIRRSGLIKHILSLYNF